MVLGTHAGICVAKLGFYIYYLAALYPILGHVQEDSLNNRNSPNFSNIYLDRKEKSDKEPSLQQKRCHNTKHVFWNPIVSWKGL